MGAGVADDVPGVDAVLRGDGPLFDAVVVPSSDSDGVLPDGCFDLVCPDYPHLSVCVVVFMGWIFCSNLSCLRSGMQSTILNLSCLFSCIMDQVTVCVLMC